MYINPLFLKIFNRKLDNIACCWLFAIIGHECRHAWQLKQKKESWNDELFNPVNPFSVSEQEKYFNREVEIDAYAFQNSVLKYLGLQGLEEKDLKVNYKKMSEKASEIYDYYSSIFDKFWKYML